MGGFPEVELERALESFDGMILEQRGPVLAQGIGFPNPPSPQRRAAGPARR